MNFDSRTDTANIVDSFLSKSVALTPGSASFPGSQNHLIIALMQWQYWWWFWFSMIVVLYYSFSTRLISNRLGYQNPKIVTSYRSHGRWGDLIICLIPIFWCLNILSSSHFLLRALEWQTETSPFTLRVRGKQWYWVYKFDLNNATHIDDLPKLIGYDKKVFFQRTTTNRHERVLKTNRFKYFTDSRQSAALEKSNTLMNRDKNFYQNKLEYAMRTVKYSKTNGLFNNYKNRFFNYLQNFNYSAAQAPLFYSENYKILKNSLLKYLVYGQASHCQESIIKSHKSLIKAYIMNFSDSKNLYAKMMGNTLVNTIVESRERNALEHFIRKAIIDKLTFYRLSKISAFYQEYHRYPNMGPSTCKNVPHNLLIKVLNRLAKIGIYKVRRTYIPIKPNLSKLVLKLRERRIVPAVLLKPGTVLNYYRDTVRSVKDTTNVLNYYLNCRYGNLKKDVLGQILRIIQQGKPMVSRNLSYGPLLRYSTREKALKLPHNSRLTPNISITNGISGDTATDYVKHLNRLNYQDLASKTKTNLMESSLHSYNKSKDLKNALSLKSKLFGISKSAAERNGGRAVQNLRKVILIFGPDNPIRKRIIYLFHRSSQNHFMMHLARRNSQPRTDIRRTRQFDLHLPDIEAGDFHLKRHSWYVSKNKANYSKTAAYLYKLAMDHEIVKDHYKNMYKVHILNWYLFSSRKGLVIRWGWSSQEHLPLRFEVFKKMLTLQVEKMIHRLGFPHYVYLTHEVLFEDNTAFQQLFFRQFHGKLMSLIYNEIQGRYVQPKYYMDDHKIPNKYWKAMTPSLRNFCLIRDKLPRIIPSAKVVGSLNDLFHKGGIVERSWLSDNMVHSYYRSIFVYKKDMYCFQRTPWNEKNVYWFNKSRNWRNCERSMHLSDALDDGNKPPLYATERGAYLLKLDDTSHWGIFNRANRSTTKKAKCMQRHYRGIVKNVEGVIYQNAVNFYKTFTTMKKNVERGDVLLNSTKGVVLDTLRWENSIKKELAAKKVIEVIFRLNDDHMRGFKKINPSVIKYTHLLKGDDGKFICNLNIINMKIVDKVYVEAAKRARIFIESIINDHKVVEPLVKSWISGYKSIISTIWSQDKRRLGSIFKYLDKVGIYHYQYLEKTNRRTPDIQASCWVYFEKSRKIKSDFMGRYNKTNCFVPFMKKSLSKLNLTGLDNTSIVDIITLLQYVEHSDRLSGRISNWKQMPQILNQIILELTNKHRSHNLSEYLRAYTVNKKINLWFDNVMYVRVKQPALWLIRYFLCTHRNTTRDIWRRVVKLSFTRAEGFNNYLNEMDWAYDMGSTFNKVKRLGEGFVFKSIKDQLLSSTARTTSQKYVTPVSGIFRFDMNIIKKTVNSVKDFNRWVKSTENYKGPVILIKNTLNSDKPLGIRFSKNTKILRNSEDNTNLTIKQKKVEKTIFSSKLNQRDINYSIDGTNGPNLKKVNGVLVTTPGYLEENQYDFKEHSRLYNEKDNMSRLNKAYPYQKRLLWVSKQILLPTHTAITIITNSYDVIHSWFVPGLGLKMDCVPGRSTHHTIYVEHTGYYYGQCAEVCGRRHHHMPIKLLAIPLPHFTYWWKKYIQPSMH